MVKQVWRYDIYLVSPDPVQGPGIQKMRPCVAILPDEMNRYLRSRF